MGRINIGSRAGFGESEGFTAREYDEEVAIELVEHKVQLISSLIDKHDHFTAYLYGMGGHPKSTYLDLMNVSGLELVFCRSQLPAALFMLRPVIASYAGLFKIHDSASLCSAFMRLVQNSMAGIYVFSDLCEEQFVHQVRKSNVESYDFGIKRDPTYFYYVVDADNAESHTGVYELVSYGTSSPGFSSSF